jgi:maltose-binding protein MalE
MKKMYAMLLAIGLMLSFVSCASNQTSKKSDEIDPLLAFTASEVNRTLPMEVDEYTRADACVALPNNTLRYVYTLTQWVKEDMDMSLLKEAITPILKQNFNNIAEIQQFRDMKATLEFQYFDANGEEAFLISLPYTEY